MEFLIENKENENEINLVFYNSLQEHETKLSIILNEYRNKIDDINPQQWKVNRKKHNEYDFDVNSKIINRAFYKLWEIIQKYNIWDTLSSPDILHIAEAPGGFIQCSLYKNEKTKKKITKQQTIVDDDGFTSIKKIKDTSKKCIIHTISLVKEFDKNASISNYSKHILQKNVTVITGVDSTGNICNLDNIDYIYNTYKIKYNYITADGGFDEGSQFNSKEELHYTLICSEIYTGISLNIKGGHFILKMFDLHTDSSIHLLYLLTLFYKEVYIYKPLTSRPTNSEKYIICKNYQCNDSSYLVKIQNVLRRICQNKSSDRFFNIFSKIPQDFFDQINNVNEIFLKEQIKYLEKYINVCIQKTILPVVNKEVTFRKWSKQFDFS